MRGPSIGIAASGRAQPAPLFSASFHRNNGARADSAQKSKLVTCTNLLSSNSLKYAFHDSTPLENALNSRPAVATRHTAGRTCDSSACRPREVCYMMSLTSIGAQRAAKSQRHRQGQEKLKKRGSQIMATPKGMGLSTPRSYKQIR